MFKRILIGLAFFVLVIGAAMAGYSAWAYQRALAEAGVSPDAYVSGDPKAPVTIVEFVDYQCPYCLQMSQHLGEALRTETGVRVVIRPLPWLGNDSGQMATLVMAAGKQGKAIALHDALMTGTAPVTLAEATETAKKLGLNMEQAAKDQPEAVRQVRENLKYALSFRLNSIPALLIGGTLYVPTKETMPTVNQIRILIDEELRKARS